MQIIFIIIGIIIGFGIGIAIFLPKAKTQIKLNEKIIQQNKENEKINSNLLNEKQHIQNEISQLINKEENLKKLIESLKNTQQSLQENTNTIKDLLQNQISEKALQLSQEYQNSEEELKNHYLELQKQCVNNLQIELKQTEEKINLYKLKLQNLSEQVTTATKAAKRAEQIKQQQNFYKLNLTEIDLKEIHKLREIEQFLRDTKPLNKVIWKVYYEHPYNQLVGRVLGKEKHCGIYKITNLQNQMCYIGQSTSIAERWRQHIKRGIGADEPTKNKLYPAMLSFGIENFSFELIEDCDKDKLNEREKYWINYFHGQDFGYNITAGNK